MGLDVVTGYERKGIKLGLAHIKEGEGGRSVFLGYS